MEMTERKVAYIFDEKLIEECDRLPTVQNRVSHHSKANYCFLLIPNTCLI